LLGAVKASCLHDGSFVTFVYNWRNFVVLKQLSGVSSPLIAIVAVVSMVLTGCSQPGGKLARTWDVYQNERYGFEFPYPSNWVAAPLVANQDGQTFSDPQNPAVKILGWASQVSLEPDNLSGLVQKNVVVAPNFVTQQGLQGLLHVEVGAEVSFITLTLIQNGVVYSWQGRSPSDQFAKYYEFFNYVAGQYRIVESVE